MKLSSTPGGNALGRQQRTSVDTPPSTGSPAALAAGASAVSPPLAPPLAFKLTVAATPSTELECAERFVNELIEECRRAQDSMMHDDPLVLGSPLSPPASSPWVPVGSVSEPGTGPRRGRLQSDTTGRRQHGGGGHRRPETRSRDDDQDDRRSTKSACQVVPSESRLQTEL